LGSDDWIGRAGPWAPIVGGLVEFGLCLATGILLVPLLHVAWSDVVLIGAVLGVVEGARIFGRRRRVVASSAPEASDEERAALLRATEGDVDGLSPHLVPEARRLIDAERAAADRRYHRDLLLTAALGFLGLVHATWSRELTGLAVSVPIVIAAFVLARSIWSSRRGHLDATAAALDDRRL
jgi:hypothetical protein